MGYQKKEKFDKIDRSKMELKERNKRTRTGAYKSSKIKAHGKHHKHI